MSYELVWHTKGKVLLLTLEGAYLLEDAIKVNELVLDQLEQAQTPMILLIDAMKHNPPHNFADIRATQTFQDHHMLSNILVLTDDRIIKLAMMIIFNLSKANLLLCENWDQVQARLRIISHPRE